MHQFRECDKYLPKIIKLGNSTKKHFVGALLILILLRKINLKNFASVRILTKR
ncbi:hypothetical protein CLW00_101401 [Mongoliibacter ruber]|uniref:Uncharacterized protein n=1 Tax=Mongoliibacter ruber TaxID=1750599 RepID=A0A2T0WVL8_9BACT|nr:hypothetical protein CLW00_101401 [Mongoliibacter ruber]